MRAACRRLTTITALGMVGVTSLGCATSSACIVRGDHVSMEVQIPADVDSHEPMRIWVSDVSAQVDASRPDGVRVAITRPIRIDGLLPNPPGAALDGYVRRGAVSIDGVVRAQSDLAGQLHADGRAGIRFTNASFNRMIETRFACSEVALGISEERPLRRDAPHVPEIGDHTLLPTGTVSFVGGITRFEVGSVTSGVFGSTFRGRILGRTATHLDVDVVDSGLRIQGRVASDAFTEGPPGRIPDAAVSLFSDGQVHYALAEDAQLVPARIRAGTPLHLGATSEVRIGAVTHDVAACVLMGEGSRVAIHVFVPARVVGDAATAARCELVETRRARGFVTEGRGLRDAFGDGGEHRLYVDVDALGSPPARASAGTGDSRHAAPGPTSCGPSGSCGR